MPAACAALSLEACGEAIGTQQPGDASLRGGHAAADNAPADAGHGGALTEAHGKEMYKFADNLIDVGFELMKKAEKIAKTAENKKRKMRAKESQGSSKAAKRA